MSALGLGRVKTPEHATRVEASRPNCASRESNHTAHGQLEASLENCIFYILPMYEFLHSQGHKPEMLMSEQMMSALPLEADTKPDIAAGSLRPITINSFIGSGEQHRGYGEAKVSWRS